MNRFIFGGGLLLSFIILGVVLANIWGSSGNVPEDVQAGFAVWQKYSCESCHTIYGQGGNYAPDLTHIYSLRGEQYISEFLVDPATFHPNQRIMPRFTITKTETSNLIAMLRWTSESSLGADWPPNPIQVAGSGAGFASSPQASDNTSSEIAGRAVYSRFCASCHSIEPNIVIVGPSFWGLADRAIARFPDTAPEDYIRTSILDPSAYVVEGFQDVMQKNLAEVLSSNDIDSLIAFIMTLRDKS